MRHVVCPVEKLPPGSRTCVPIGTYGVAVFNVAGEFFALRNYCPHSGGPLCEGLVTGTTLWDREEGIRWVRDGEVVRCPWHRWEFDIRTGHSLTEPGIRVASFPAYESDGMVVVEARGGANA
jgi:nitrite reductase/ring-hydroxylating ferredoxin subunit